jgi:hypothetical protein
MMGKLTYKQLRAGTISAEKLTELFQVITDDRTAALAIFYVKIHDAKDDAELDEIKGALRL